MTRRTALSLLLPACLPAQSSKKIEIRGVYGNPKPLWDKGARLDEYGVNAAFVHSGSITPSLMERCRAEGARVFAEFATLNGKGYVEKHPEAWPIDERGEKSPPATWFTGACPTEPGFHAWRMRQLEELLDRYDLAGVWMDYFHWHAQFEDPEPILPETCFSPTCIAAFESATKIRVPAGPTAERAKWILTRHDNQWRDWRANQLLKWARDIKDVVQRKRPGAMLGLYHCPWTDEEYNGARRRILGLDLTSLAGVVDVFSPMVYHGRMHRRPEWVGENVHWLSGKLAGRAKIWPIVQAHSDPAVITADEFEQVLRLGTSGRATGVMMFTTQSVTADPAKMERMRSLYREWL